MRKAKVLVHGIFAGILSEENRNKFSFDYDQKYKGPPVSLALPVREESYEFLSFPPFFDGLLPEGDMLAGLLRHRKLDKNDFLGQLIAVGEDLVGAVTVQEISDV